MYLLYELKHYFYLLSHLLYVLVLLLFLAISLGSVERLKTNQVVIAGHCRGLILLKQLISVLGELTGQAAIARLIHEELLISAGRCLGIKRKLLAHWSGRIEAIEVPRHLPADIKSSS